MSENNASGVYTITCGSTGRVYIGSSCNIRNRMYKHWASLKSGDHENKEMQADYTFFGRDSFTTQTLQLCPRDECRLTEQYEMVHAMRAGLDLYNIRSACAAPVTTEAEVLAMMEAW